MDELKKHICGGIPASSPEAQSAGEASASAPAASGIQWVYEF